MTKETFIQAINIPSFKKNLLGMDLSAKILPGNTEKASIWDGYVETLTNEMKEQVTKNSKAYFATILSTNKGGFVVDIMNTVKIKCPAKINLTLEVVNKRADNIEYNGRKCEILNGKNENAPSYNQLVNYVKEDNNTKTIVFGFEYISMRYKYQDISWLYDIDFELLTNVDKIICVGDWANDIAARFNVAGFDKEQIMVCKDFTNLKECLDNSNGTIYALLNMGTEVPFKESIK